MACKSCKNKETIQAHLIPKTFATEVESDDQQAHAAGVVDGETYRHSQSGLFDSDILFAECDNRIGRWEEYAKNVLEQIREIAAGKPPGGRADETPKKHEIEAHGDKLLRCFAAILWKHSVAKEKFGGGLSLGPYQEILHRIAFDEGSIPDRVDAFIFRLKVSRNDDEVYYYRQPVTDTIPNPDTGDRVNFHRMMLGGCLIFVRLDKRHLSTPILKGCWLREKKKFDFLAWPAKGFEEFRKPHQFMEDNSPLSEYIDERHQ